MTQLKIKIKKSKLIRKIEGEKVTGYYGRVVSTGKKTFEVLSPLWQGGGYKAGVAI